MLSSLEFLGRVKATDCEKEPPGRLVGRKRKREPLEEVNSTKALSRPGSQRTDLEEKKGGKGMLRSFLDKLLMREKPDKEPQVEVHGCENVANVTPPPRKAARTNGRSVANSPITSVARCEPAASLAGLAGREYFIPILPESTIEFAASLPQRGTENAGEPLLPPREETADALPTLVIDLDETLVHSSLQPLANQSFAFSIEQAGDVFHISVKLRPGVRQFFEAIAGKFEVAIFTASERHYAEFVVGKVREICAGVDICQHVLYRDSCTQLGNAFVKDLARLGRPLASTIILDNSPAAFAYDLDSGIPIVSWFGENENDTQLMSLVPLLEELRGVEDVRPVLGSIFGMAATVQQHLEDQSLSHQWIIM